MHECAYWPEQDNRLGLDSPAWLQETRECSIMELFKENFKRRWRKEQFGGAPHLYKLTCISIITNYLRIIWYNKLSMDISTDFRLLLCIKQYFLIIFANHHINKVQKTFVNIMKTYRRVLTKHLIHILTHEHIFTATQERINPKHHMDILLRFNQ